MSFFSKILKRDRTVSREEFQKHYTPAREALINRDVESAKEHLKTLQAFNPHPLDKIRYLFLEGLHSYLIHNYKLAEKILEELLGLTTTEINLDPNDILRCKVALGQTKFRLGSNPEALNIITEANSYYHKINTSEFDQLMAIQNLLGAIHFSSGDIEAARVAYEMSLSIAKTIDDKWGMSVVLNNLGNIYQNRGEFDMSLDYYQQSLGIKEESGFDQAAAVTRANIGELFLQKGDILTANENLTQSLENLRGGNPIYVSGILYSLILTNAEYNLAAASDYLMELQQLDQNQPIISQQTKLAEATILMHSSHRTISQAKAQQLFMEVSGDQVINYEMTLYAKLNLCNMLVKEYKSSPDKDILLEIQSIIQEIDNLGQLSNSYVVKAEIALIQANLSVLLNNFDLAKTHLKEAQAMAEDKKLYHLAYRISRAHDEVLEQEQLHQDPETEDKLVEILELSSLETNISRLIKKEIEEIPDEIREESILVLILNNAGVNLFSHKFQDTTEINEHLIASFLSAINSFTTEAFSASGMIERIKHKEFTLIVKPLDTIFLCYAFKGDSYTASQKIDVLGKVLRSNTPLWDDLLEFNTGLLKINQTSIIDIMEDIFTKQNDNQGNY